MELQINSQDIDKQGDLSKALVIRTNEDNARAALILRGIKGLKETVQNTFRPHIENAHKTWKNLIAQEKKFLEPLDNCEKIVKEKVKTFTFEQEEKQRKMEAKAQAENKVVPDSIMERLNKKQEGIVVVCAWKYRIINEALIPRQYLEVNESAIRKVVNALQEKTEIPGVEVYEDKQVRVNS